MKNYYKVWQQKFFQKKIQNLLQSATRWKFILDWKFITKYDRNLLQSVTGITKCDKIYYKVWQVLQSVTEIYYKVWQVLQSVTIITKCDSTRIKKSYRDKSWYVWTLRQVCSINTRQYFEKKSQSGFSVIVIFLLNVKPYNNKH